MKCQLCNRVHGIDPCYVCEEIGHEPLQCPVKCSCLSVSSSYSNGILVSKCLGRYEKPHKITDHSCGYCRGLHFGEKLS